MFLLSSFRAQHELIHETLTTPAAAGLKLIFSHFDGYSPILDGSIRTVTAEPSDAASGNSGSIMVTVDVQASNLSYKDNIRVRQQDEEIFISTGGLSLLSYTTAPRLIISVVISLPARHEIGDMTITTMSLPLFFHTSAEKSRDIKLISHSAPITVTNIEAHSLTITSQSGAITFEDGSKQKVDEFIKVASSSGGIKLRTSLLSPVIAVESSSSSLALKIKTTATELKVKGSSGIVVGEVEYINSASDSVSTFENNSGSLNVILRNWSGVLTAESGSGSKNVRGRELERANDGWKKGNSLAKASFRTRSGALSVEVL